MMGDHRVSIDISVMGFDGKVEKIDCWWNWDADVPSRVYRLMIKMAEKAHLPVDYDVDLGDEYE